MPTPCIQSLGAKVTIVFPVAPGESPYGRLYCGFDISMAVIRNVPISSPVARSKLFVRFAESIQAPSIQFIPEPGSLDWCCARHECARHDDSSSLGLDPCFLVARTPPGSSSIMRRHRVLAHSRTIFQNVTTD